MATNGKTAIVPPQNLEAEESVLGAMMVSESTIDPVLLDVRLQAEDFYRDRHRTIFEAIIRLNENAEPVDVLTVAEALAQHGQLDEVGGQDVIAQPRRQGPRARATPSTTRRSSSRTRCCGACAAPPSRSSSRSTSATASPRSSSSRPSGCSSRSPTRSRPSDFREIGEILHDEIDKLEKLAERRLRDHRHRRPASATSTTSTGGFQPGNLIVIAARPAMGKSTLVCNIAENVAVKHGSPVAFFSLEMSETELAHRFIASRARISSDRLRKGKVASKDWPKVVKACNELEEAPLWIDDSSDLGLLDLRAKARRLHAQEQGRGPRASGWSSSTTCS